MASIDQFSIVLGGFHDSALRREGFIGSVGRRSCEGTYGHRAVETQRAVSSMLVFGAEPGRSAVMFERSLRI